MKITALEEYGLRCMLQLALSDQEGPMTVAQVAENEGLSQEYAGKLLNLLRQEGVVHSIRGRNGGFELARPANEITLADVVRALSQDLFDSEACERFPGAEDRCVHSSGCALRPVLWTLSRMISRTLESLTLADLMRTEKQVSEELRPHLEAMPGDVPVLEAGGTKRHQVQLPDAS